MRRIVLPALLLTTAFFGFAHSAGAVLIYSETVNGDLSGNRLATTNIVLTSATNSFTGNTIGGDLDYVSFTVPAGMTMTAIKLASFVSADDIGFMALQAGSTFTTPASAPNVAVILGYTHYGPGPGASPVGSNTLVPMSTAAGAIGFSLPLGAGPYTLWIQQTNAQNIAYQFDIVVVPEPTSVALLGIGLCGLALVRRRRA